MANTKFEQTLASILEAATSPEVEQTKVASLETRLEELDGDVAKSLVKVANKLRTISTEPTYPDMIAFIGEG